MARPTAVPMMPDSASGVSGFAEVLLQPVGDPEDAAQLADVLAHQDHLAVGVERLAEPVVERLAQGECLGHQCDPPSNDAW
jgi:hypothetical protein